MSKEDVEELLREFESKFQRHSPEYTFLTKKNVANWLRTKLTPLVAQQLPQAPVEEKCGYMILTPTPIHNGGMWCAEKTPCKEHGDWKKDWPPKFVLTTTASKKEQKEGVECRHNKGQTAKWVCDCGKVFDDMQGLALEALSETPTPRTNPFILGTPAVPGYKTTTANTVDTPIPTVKELKSQAYWDGYEEGRKSAVAVDKAFEAGRLQGIADAIAVVPEEVVLSHIGEDPGNMLQRIADGLAVQNKDSWNACRQAMLTALSSLTHKK